MKPKSSHLGLLFSPVFACPCGGVAPLAVKLAGIGTIRLLANGNKTVSTKLALLQRRTAAVKYRFKFRVQRQNRIFEILAQQAVCIGDAKHIASAVKRQALLVMAVVVGTHRCNKTANVPKFGTGEFSVCRNDPPFS